MKQSLVLLIGLLGFIPVLILLFTNHFGVAIRITNYIFFILLLGVIIGVFAKK